MIRIAYLTARTYRDKPMGPHELPPAEAADFAILAPAAARRGLSLEPVRWDEPDLRTQSFDAALIRSAWDYHERPAVFEATLRALPFRVFNSADIVAWNARKTYLRGLGAAGAPTIDTLWPETLDAHVVAQAFADLDAAEIVLKPQVGAGSRRTIRLKRNAWSAADLIDGPLGPAMIQPFLPSIATEGEASLFLFGGQIGHAIRKIPKAGGWFANVDDPRFAPMAPDAEMLAVAERVIAAAPGGMLYARVDLVRGLDGRLKLIELEAIEPYLFFVFAPTAADVFIDALTRALG
jgi:glutathione synthase/RimK-type ligase-like ATP-grasp enzyme